jgi:hypothetical protein
MDVAKNNVAGIENNYLKNRYFSCKMSHDEIVGIRAYMAENVCPSYLTNFFSFFHD